VERVVACWLQVQDADVRCAQSQKDCTPTQGDYYQRRMDLARRRYLSAIKALAVVCKLALTVLQVNIPKRRCVPRPHAGDPTNRYCQVIVMSFRIGVSVGSVVVRITRYLK
jgi:hypothetical protein